MEINLEQAKQLGPNLKFVQTDEHFVFVVDRNADLKKPAPGKKMHQLASSGGFQWLNDVFKANIYIGRT
jgi:hypothetical protein